MASSLNRPDAGLPRLYAILDLESAFARGLQPLGVLSAWLDAGVRLVQLRAKSLTFGPFVELAETVVARCHAANAVCIVNDRADVALLAAADGVHVGQADLTVDEVRLVFPGARHVGLSTHTADQLTAALRTGASYVAFGPVFETTSKAKPDPAVGPAGLAAVRALMRADPRALVAIGGITAESAPLVIQSGADAVAVIADLVDGDPGARARALLGALA